MSPVEETALALYQAHRDTDRAVLAALLDDCLAPAEYTAQLDAIRIAMSEDAQVQAQSHWCGETVTIE